MRNPRLWALAALVALGGYEAARGWDATYLYTRGARAPFTLNFGANTVSSVEEEATRAGIAKGDTLRSINGRPVTSPARPNEILRRTPGGAVWHVAWSRPDGRQGEGDIRLVPYANQNPRWTDYVIGFLVDYGTRWLCLALGLYVVFLRPRDALAWLLLMMLACFCQSASGVGNPALGWPQPWKSLGVFYLYWAQNSWGTWVLLFGIYFPDPHSRVRLMAWTRWALGVPSLVWATFVSIVLVLETSGVPFSPAWLPTLNWVSRGFSLVTPACLAVFFANLCYKAVREQVPDSRRRLWILFWGMQTSLVPPLLSIVWQISQHKQLDDLGPFVVVTVIGSLFLFPVTLTYVIVVRKAMDVRVVLRQGLRYALAQRAVGVGATLAACAIVGVGVHTIASDSVDRPARFWALGLCSVAIVALRLSAGWLRQHLDRRFFREQVEAEQVLVSLSGEVRAIRDAGELKQRVCSRISEAMHVPEVRITSNGPGAGFELALPLEAGETRLGSLVLGPKRSEEPYSKSDRRLLETVAAQTALALDNLRLAATVVEEAARRERIHRELEIASEVQQRLFPQSAPAVRGLEYAARCHPAQTVGGDYYDYFLDSAGQLVLAIGDICGKGVPAALLMSGLQASLRGLSAGGVCDPGDLLGRLNTLVYDFTPRNRFATLWCGRFDPASRRLRYVNAGHGEAWLLAADGVRPLASTRGLALGLVHQTAYRCEELTLRPGDLLAVCTDGVTEARNGAGDEFGAARFSAALDAGRRLDPPVLLDALLEEVERFAGGAEQHDDITLLVARLVP